jgi:putative inorganic carbon (HCO3(-)) transporter
MRLFEISGLSRILELAMEGALYFLVIGISISNGLTSIGVALVLLVWCVKKTVLQEKPVLPRALVIFSALLFFSFAASLTHSEYLGQSLYALFFKYGKYLLLMMAIADGIKDKRVATRLALVLCLTATLICWDGFYQFFSGRDLFLQRLPGKLDVYHGAFEFHSFRITATFPAANTMASYLVPVLMLGLALSFFYREKSRNAHWAKGACLASMVACLLLTFSRGGLIACLGGVLILAFLFRKKILWVIPLVFLVVFLFGKNLYGNRAVHDGAIDPTVETRLVMLKDATAMLRTHPWTGIGLNTYYKTHEKNRTLAIPPSYAHNSYIQMIAEVGIMGFMAFMALMIYWFSWGLHAFQRLRDPELRFLLGGVLAGVFGLCVASFFDNVLFELLPATLFWTLLGYGVALVRIKAGNNLS